MSEDNNTLIDHYKAEIDKLKRENISLRKDRTGKLKDADARVTEKDAELEKLRKQVGDLSKKLEDLPREQQAENDRLKGQIRTRAHRDEFEKQARELKADPAAVEALWRLSEYKAEADEVDAKAIKEAINKTLEANPFFKGEGRQVQPGPGGGQGARSGEPGMFTMTYEQGRDLEFLTKNFDRIKQAKREGKLVNLPPKGGFGFPEPEK